MRIGIWLLILVAVVSAAQGQTVGSRPTGERSANLPADIFADSRSRLPLLKRADMKDEAARAIYDSIAGTSTTPPYATIAVALYTPAVAKSIREINDYLRRRSSLDARLCELIILVTAREIDQKYEWSAHEPAALRAGLEPAVIDVVRLNKPVQGLAEKDAVIIQFGRQLFRQKKVEADVFAKAVKQFGRQGTFDAIMLISHYAMAGVMKHATNQQPAADWDPAKFPAISGVGTATGEAGHFVDPPAREKLPPDVYPDSLYRFPLIKRADLNEHDKVIFDSVVGPDRATAPSGPVGMFLNSPELAEPGHQLNVDLRNNGVLGERLSEIIITATGREMNSQYQWNAHSPAAKRAGASDLLLDAIKYDKDLAGVDEKAALAITFTRELFRNKTVSSATFANAVKEFGRQGTVEMAELIGNYLMVTTLYNALDLRLSPNAVASLPHRVGAPFGVAP